VLGLIFVKALVAVPCLVVLKVFLFSSLVVERMEGETLWDEFSCAFLAGFEAVISFSIS
jgi:hypothetical protein